MQEEVDTFRVSPFAIWRFAFPAVVTGAVTVAAVMYLRGNAFHWPSSLVSGIAAGFVVLVLYRGTGLRVVPLGIEFPGATGRVQLVRWADMRSVAVARRQWLQPCFRVETTDGRVFWIPLATQNLGRMRELVVRYGGETHSLVVALDRPAHSVL